MLLAAGAPSPRAVGVEARLDVCDELLAVMRFGYVVVEKSRIATLAEKLGPHRSKRERAFGHSVAPGNLGRNVQPSGARQLRMHQLDRDQVREKAGMAVLPREWRGAPDLHEACP